MTEENIQVRNKHKKFNISSHQEMQINAAMSSCHTPAVAGQLVTTPDGITNTLLVEMSNGRADFQIILQFIRKVSVQLPHELAIVLLRIYFK